MSDEERRPKSMPIDQLQEDMIILLGESKVDPRHEHLNVLMDDAQCVAYAVALARLEAWLREDVIHTRHVHWMNRHATFKHWSVELHDPHEIRATGATLAEAILAAIDKAEEKA